MKILREKTVEISKVAMPKQKPPLYQFAYVRACVRG